MLCIVTGNFVWRSPVIHLVEVVGAGQHSCQSLQSGFPRGASADRKEHFDTAPVRGLCTSPLAASVGAGRTRRPAGSMDALIAVLHCLAPAVSLFLVEHFHRRIQGCEVRV